MPEDAGVWQEVWRFTHKPVQIKNRVEIQIKILLTYTLFNLEQQINKSALNSLQFTTIST